jgi:predicted MFS family arabinose efflux permease
VHALLAVFCPFAAGYFLSYFFRNVNAVIARDLAQEFALGPAELGLLTSTYLLAFAAFQLPLGVLLDRYGPRRVVAALMCVTAAGALSFGLARDFAALSVGRALIGLGVSAGLMGSIKAFTLWFPLSRIATLNGLMLAVGGVGAMSATAPVEALLGPFGWRNLFLGLAALSLGAAGLIFLAVPEKELPGRAAPLAQLVAAFRSIFASGLFWRITLPLIAGHGTYQALQGLWLAPWLYDVAGLARAQVANYLLLTTAAYTAGSIAVGVLSDGLARVGVSRLAVYKIGLSFALGMFVLIAAGATSSLAALLAAYGFSLITASLSYALFAQHFPPEIGGRVNTASNLLLFSCSFAFQWGIGAVLRLYPVVDGRYAPEGYRAAFFALALLQLAAIAWLIPLRVRPPADA